MQPLKLAPACLGSRTRDGSHGAREKKPHHTSTHNWTELDREGEFYEFDCACEDRCDGRNKAMERCSKIYDSNVLQNLKLRREGVRCGSG